MGQNQHLDNPHISRYHSDRQPAMTSAPNTFTPKADTWPPLAASKYRISNTFSQFCQWELAIKKEGNMKPESWVGLNPLNLASSAQVFIITPLDHKAPHSMSAISSGLYSITCVQDNTPIIPSSISLHGQSFGGPAGSTTQNDDSNIWFITWFKSSGVQLERIHATQNDLHGKLEITDQVCEYVVKNKDIQKSYTELVHFNKAAKENVLCELQDWVFELVAASGEGK